MVNIKKIRYLLFLICFSSILPAQKSIQVSPVSEKQIGMASGVYINYGTAGAEADGLLNCKVEVAYSLNPRPLLSLVT